MLRYYVSDLPENGDKDAERLTHAYNLNRNRTTDNGPFDLVLSSPPPEFTFHYDEDAPTTTGKERVDFTDQLEKGIAKAARH